MQGGAGKAYPKIFFGVGQRLSLPVGWKLSLRPPSTVVAGGTDVKENAGKRCGNVGLERRRYRTSHLSGVGRTAGRGVAGSMLHESETRRRRLRAKPASSISFSPESFLPGRDRPEGRYPRSLSRRVGGQAFTAGTGRRPRKHRGRKDFFGRGWFQQAGAGRVWGPRFPPSILGAKGAATLAQGCAGAHAVSNISERLRLRFIQDP